MTDTLTAETAALIKAMARARVNEAYGFDAWAILSTAVKAGFCKGVRDDLKLIFRAGYTVQPKEATEEQWGGLARQIMLWLNLDGRPTPRLLFDHLKYSGHEVPQWLRDEPEMQHLDHVPSKGTRCVILYRAMCAASPIKEPTNAEGE